MKLHNWYYANVMYIVLHIQGQTIKVASFKCIRNLLLDNAEEWVDSKAQFFITIILHKVLLAMNNGEQM